MKLVTEHHTFWASKEEHDWDPGRITYRFGNKKGRPKPCITIDLYHESPNQWIMILQDLAYYSTCSREKNLERGSGTVEMAQGAIKALCDMYPIRKIEFTDKSYFPHPAGNVPLPEKLVLSGKDTWYQTYLSAKPTASTKRVLARYYKARELPTRYIGIAESAAATISAHFSQRGRDVTEAEITDVLRKLGLQGLTATSWMIPVKQVQTYPAARLVASQSGGAPPIDPPPRYIYRGLNCEMKNVY